MASLRLFVVISFLLDGSARGQDTNFTSRCLWENMNSLSCTSAGITNLQDIGQENDKLPSWPRSPRLLKTMKHINLSNNMISSLHLNIFYKFLSLETLNFSNNYISMVSMNYKKEGKHDILASLHTLVIDRNRLTFVPKGLGNLRSLQTVHLSANSIVRIQRDDFVNCTELQNLDLGENRIHKIDPDAFRDLRSLQVLRLSNNALVSITPLVFLYSHVLRADIDLSYNRWACDCRILPLKHLVTSVHVAIKKKWNVTCNTPPSRTGNHLLSIDLVNGSCQSPVDKYIYARRIAIKKKEKMYLPCNITDNAGNKKAFWWTPQGIISGEPLVTNHYIDRINNFLLTEPDRSHEGLYICIADTERIVYQIHFQTDTKKTLIRRPRDVQPLNTRIRTEDDFSRAVALSVVISFIGAFLLGVFLRPCLERLWRKLCKCKPSRKKTSAESHDNEGFYEENVSERHSSNTPGSSLPVLVSKDKSSESHTGYEDPDSTKYATITYNEREIHYKDEQVPTRSEPQERRSGIYESAEAENKDLHTTGNSKSTNSKRVTWAIKDSNPTVNLKNVISLLKPINFIVPTTQMENTDNHDQSIILSGRKPEDNYSDTVTPKQKRVSFSDSTSDESEFWDADDVLSDEDIIVNYVSTQQVGSASNGHVIPTVNLRYVMSLLKPINFIVPEEAKNHYEDLSNSSSQFKDINHGLHDRSFSDDGSTSSVGDHSSEEETIITTNTTRENDSSKVNLKHIMSLLKPINIIIPELAVCDIVKSPTQKQMFPIALSRYSKYRTNYNQNQDIRRSGAPTEDTIHKNVSDDSSSPADETNDYSKSFIRPQNNIEIKQTLYDSSSSEDGSEDGRTIMNSVLLTTKPETWRTKESDSPTVNLKHIMTLVKPINIIIPGPTMSDLVIGPAQKPSSISSYPEYRMEEIDNLHYRDNIQFGGIEDESQSKETSYHSSSSDDGSIDFDYSSDETVTLNSVVLPRKQASWKSNIDTGPTVNLQQVISLLKPITIIAPEPPVSELERNLSQETFYPGGILRPSEDRIEERASPQNHYQDVKQSSIRPTYYTEGKKTFSDSSSSEDESKEGHNSDEGDIVPLVMVTEQATREREENTTPTVNLKHVMSLVKPINIIIPESTIIDLVKTPSEIQFFPTSVSRYPGNRMEDIDIKLQPENELYNKSQSYNKTPTEDREGEKFYDSNSSDDGSDFHYDDSSDEEIKLNPGLPPTKQPSWTSNTDTRPTVNLHQLISLLKPISIIAPMFENRTEDTGSLLRQSQEPGNQSPNLTYEHSFVLSTRPTNDMEDMQTSSDSSSSDNESEQDHSSDYNSIIPSVSLTEQATWATQQKVSPTVNLKHAMSLIKPINITIPESPKTDLVKIPTETQLSPGIIARYPEHRIEDIQNRYDYQDMKLSGEPENKTYNENESYNKSPTLPISDSGGNKTFYESSSSDDSKQASSDEEVTMNSGLLLTKHPSWIRKGNESPKVNLQQVISLLKPITITAPDYSVTEPVGSPSQTQFFPISHTAEEAGDSISSAILPNDGKGTQTFYDSSSSEDELKVVENHSSDEDSIKNYDFLMTKQQSWSGKQNENPKVNLQQVISLLKPITIIAPDYSVTEPIRSTSQKQHFPTGSENYEAGDSMSSAILTNDSKGTQNFYDSSSSEDELKESEDHSSDEDSIKNYDLLITKQESWSGKRNESPKVNLQQVISLLKPITIIAPDYSVTEPIRSTSQKQHFPTGSENYEGGDSMSSAILTNDSKGTQNFYDSSSSEDESKESEDHSSDEDSIKNYDLLITKQESWSGKRNESPKVNLQQVISLLKPITIIAPDYSVTEPIRSTSQKQHFPTGSENYEAGDSMSSAILTNDSKGTQNFYDSSSSEDESKESEDHSSDEDSIKNYDLLITKQESWSGKRNESPKVNLQQVISLLKPITIIAPDYSVTEPVGSPSQKQYFPTGSGNYEAGDSISSAILPNDGKGTQTFYDSSSSEDELKVVENHSSDEDSIKNYDFLMTKQQSWSGKQNENPKVNLQQVISLLKPITIIAPDYSVTEPIRSTSQKQHFPTGSGNYEAGDSMSSAILTNDSKGTQNFYDSSTSEDESKESEDHSSDEDSIKNYDLLITKQESWSGKRKEDRDHSSDVESIKNSDSFITELTTWAPNENVSPTVNKHATSQQRPIGIIVPEGVIYLPTTKPATWTENIDSDIVRPSVNLKQVMSLVKPISIVCPESVSMTDLKIYYPHGHMKQYEEAENQLQDTNYEKHPEILTRPTKHEGYKEILYDSNSSDDGSNKKEENSSDEGGGMNSDLLLTRKGTWASTENASPKVNLESPMSLVNPINIKAPDCTVTEALRRFKVKYNTEVCGQQTVNQLQNSAFNDLSVDKLNSPKTIKDDESEPFDYEMGQDSEASKLNTKLLTWEYSENANPKVNLKHSMSLLKPINIIVPESSSTAVVKSPEQKYTFNIYQPGDRMENADTSHHHQDQDIRFHRGNSRKPLHKGLNSFNSDANTFYSRSSEDESSHISYKGDTKSSAHPTPEQATPLSSDNTSPKLNLMHVISLLKPINIVAPDSRHVDITRDEVGRLMDIQSSSTKNTVKRDESVKDFAGEGYEPNKAKDVLHWLNIDTNDEQNNDFPTGKTHSTQTSQQEHVFDLNTQEWTTRATVREEPLTKSMYESQVPGNKAYFIPDFGETSTEANLLDFNSKDSLHQLNVKIQKVVSPAVGYSMPKQHETYFTNRRKVFDVFSESLKEEQI